jgi:DNA invertase Pin-like site-specific DNA recombinase
MNANKERQQMKNVYSYIRWSSDRQTWGDSERRQWELAKGWCDRKGLKLSDSSFKDKGVSAWAGDNFKSGQLAQLLKTVKRGYHSDRG